MPNHLREHLRFGFWPRSIELDVPGATIRRLGTFETVVNAMKQSDRVAGGWLYPPLIGHDRPDIPSKPTMLY